MAKKIWKKSYAEKNKKNIIKKNDQEALESIYNLNFAVIAKFSKIIPSKILGIFLVA